MLESNGIPVCLGGERAMGGQGGTDDGRGARKETTTHKASARTKGKSISHLQSKRQLCPRRTDVESDWETDASDMAVPHHERSMWVTAVLSANRR